MRIPFSDVDMHGRVHNSVCLTYVENAINEFLRETDLLRYFDPHSSVHTYHARKVEVVYNRPIGFDEVVNVSAGVGRVGTSSLTFTGRIDRDGDADPSVVAEVVWVCVEVSTGRAAPIPEAARSALAATMSDSE
jgi:acyl-CoA thioester hydrolase